MPVQESMENKLYYLYNRIDNLDFSVTLNFKTNYEK
jgi:hypothetical protein